MTRLSALRPKRPQRPPMAVPIAEALAPDTYRWLLRMFRLTEHLAAIEPGVIPVDYDRLMRETPRPGRAGEE